jgi:hypothetical protein
MIALPRIRDHAACEADHHQQHHRYHSVYRSTSSRTSDIRSVLVLYDCLVSSFPEGRLSIPRGRSGRRRRGVAKRQGAWRGTRRLILDGPVVNGPVIRLRLPLFC